VEWTVGQEVAVNGLGLSHTGVGIGKVKRVLKRFVELEDGSQWKHDGSKYPHESYSQRYIEPVTDEHCEKVRRQRVIRFIEKRRYDREHELWHGITTDTLYRIAALLKEKP